MKNQEQNTTYIDEGAVLEVIRWNCTEDDRRAIHGYIEAHNVRVEDGDISDAWDALSDDQVRFPSAWAVIADRRSELTVSE
tara:strand:+ start:6120 stop:6362 length:243 start_codon:yes stop_codon:yes gene_type:complete